MIRLKRLWKIRAESPVLHKEKTWQQNLTMITPFLMT
jgi:hypothetical protein